MFLRTNIFDGSMKNYLWSDKYYLLKRLFKISVIFRTPNGDISDSCKLETLNSEITPFNKYRSYQSKT